MEEACREGDERKTNRTGREPSDDMDHEHRQGKPVIHFGSARARTHVMPEDRPAGDQLREHAACRGSGLRRKWASIGDSPPIVPPLESVPTGHDGPPRARGEPDRKIRRANETTGA